MILGELSDIVSTERGLYRVYSGMLFELIEKCHTRGRFFRLLISEAGIVVDEVRADVR